MGGLFSTMSIRVPPAVGPVLQVTLLKLEGDKMPLSHSSSGRLASYPSRFESDQEARVHAGTGSHSSLAECMYIIIFTVYKNKYIHCIYINFFKSPKESHLPHVGLTTLWCACGSRDQQHSLLRVAGRHQ